jgi:hypothetical protein
MSADKEGLRKSSEPRMGRAAMLAAANAATDEEVRELPDVRPATPRVSSMTCSKALRRGLGSALMRATVARLTGDDLIAIGAYAAPRLP